MREWSLDIRAFLTWPSPISVHNLSPKGNALAIVWGLFRKSRIWVNAIFKIILILREKEIETN